MKKLTVLHQLCNLIPPHLTSKLARECGAEKRARRFTCWSHVVSMLYGQLTHAIGLNDVCDGLANHSGKLSAIRAAVAPSKNALSHANRERPAELMERLFWEVLGHLESQQPSFGHRKRRKGLPRKFKRVIHAVDSTTIQLVANCMDWAKHRRRKAAAKLHLRLNVGSFLPGYVVVDPAKIHDAKKAREVCAGVFAGEIVVFDMAYVDFEHLFDLHRRGVYWVNRAKQNMSYHVHRRRLQKPHGRILRDDVIVLKTPQAKKAYPEKLRRVEAEVQVEGQWVVMEFITNNLEWGAHSVCDLYKSRWSIETFFKQIKQTLKLSGFLGHNANAVRWQIWSALLLYVLLRFQGHVHRWEQSFTRLFTLLRGVLWDRFHLADLLSIGCGTASGSFRYLCIPFQLNLPGFERPT